MHFYTRAVTFPRLLRSLKSVGTFLVLLQLDIFLVAKASQPLTCKITASPDPRGVALGFHGNLNCSVIQGGPADNITWTKDKEPFGGKIVTSHSTSWYWSSLQLVNVSRGDDGKYECSVRKGEQKDSDDFVLRVFVAPSIEKEHEKLQGSPGTNRELICKVSGWPEPTLVWTKNGVRINATNVGQKLVVNIELTEKEHEGKYTCLATNRLGNDSYSIILSVSGRKNPQLTITTNKPYVISAWRQNVTLRCEGTYKEKYRWKLIAIWEKNGKELLFWNSKGKIQSNDSYEVAENSLKFSMSLRIFNVSRRDAGIYHCRMVSATSAPSREIQLIIDEKDTRPKVSTSQATMTADLNTSVILECVTEVPRLLNAEYLWYFNDTLVQNSPQRTLHQNSLGIDGNISVRTTFVLDFMAVTSRDFGCYTCGVNSSAFGWIHKRIYLRERLHETGEDENYAEILLTISAATIAGSLLSLAAGLILRRTMKRKRAAKHFYNADLNNQAFQYDVFVSFSGQDFAWINDNLTPLLEDHKLKYCIHNRDFELGKSIVDNMAESVYTSRLVLVVLSKNYMTSKFCQGELEMAVQRSTVQGDRSLIVLRLDDVCIDVLPKSLRKKTFLDYSECAERNAWQIRLLKQLLKAPKLSSTGEKSDSVAPLLKV